MNQINDLIRPIQAERLELALEISRQKGVPQKQLDAFHNMVMTMNEMVNHIENGPETTKDHYGSYLPLVKTKLDVGMYVLAGAGPGLQAAARINGLL